MARHKGITSTSIVGLALLLSLTACSSDGTAGGGGGGSADATVGEGAGGTGAGGSGVVSDLGASAGGNGGTAADAATGPAPCLVDEDCPQGAGPRVCTDGLCGPAPQAGEEICGNAIDDNGDGQTDEGCGQGQECNLDADCPADPDCGATACVDGLCTGTCVTPPVPDEICGDGVDNNLDGQIDEGCPAPAACAADSDCPVDPACGGAVCVDGACQDACGPVPPAEICSNGLDDDGNGLVDEGCPAPVPCVADADCVPVDPACDVSACVNGACYDACGPVPPGEICGDGIDNDGNGIVDEGCPAPAACAADSDCPVDPACGGAACVNGACQGVCGPVPAGEICDNGIDDDLDGLVDEGCQAVPPGNACQADSDCPVDPACGDSRCVMGNCTNGCDPLPGGGGNLDVDGDGFTAAQDCNDADAAVSPAAIERCNGIDDNCNGLVDDGCVN